MKIDTATLKGLHGRHVEKTGERIALLSFSTRVQRAHSAREETIRLVYVEALLSGAGIYSRAKFLDTLSTLGSSITVGADVDAIHISMYALDTTCKSTLALFEASFSKPHFDQKELIRIKEYLKNALILAEEDARARAYQNFSNALTDIHDPQYVFPIDEILKQLKTITRKDLIVFHAAFLTSSWMYTTGGGEVSINNITRSLAKLRRTYKVTTEEVTLAYNPKHVSKQILQLINIPHKQNIEFSIGGQLPLRRTDDAYPAFVFGMSVLALYGGFTGRLMSIVREKEGLTYSIYGQPERSTTTQEGFWRIMTFFNQKDAVRGITSTLREIKRMQKGGITEDELKRFKAILTTRYTMIQDSLIKKVREIHGYTRAGMSEDDFVTFKKKLLAVTQKEVNITMKKYLDPEKMVISGAGPVQSVKKELEIIVK